MMQATTIQNLKRARGIDPDVDKAVLASGVGKSELLAARKLKMYINQLSYAKKQCEKRLSQLGWDGAFPHQDEYSKVQTIISVCRNILKSPEHFSDQFLKFIYKTLSSILQ